MKTWSISVVVAVVAVAIIAGMCLYTVDETKQAVVTRFERVVRTETKPGLKFKLPVIETVIYYPRNLQIWDGKKEEIPTLEKTYIYVESYATCKIG